jgi:type IV secretory pathway ATPase VirB11/archaellum biosynthesis ATPase
MIDNRQESPVSGNLPAEASRYEKISDRVDSKSMIAKLRCNECRRCGKSKNFSNLAFINCIVGIIKREGKDSLAGIVTGDGVRLSKPGIGKLAQLLEKSASFREFNIKLTDAFKETCSVGYKECKLTKLENPIEIRRILATQGIIIDLLGYHAFLKKLKVFCETNLECSKCLGLNQSKIRKVLEEIESLDLFQADLSNNCDPISTLPRSEQNSIAGLLEFDDRTKKTGDIEPFQDMCLEESYPVDNASIFQVDIFSDGTSFEYLYHVQRTLPFSNEFFQYLRHKFDEEANEQLIEEKNRTFSLLLSKLISIFHKNIESRLNIRESNVQDVICLLLCFSLLGFEKLFPLLLDDYIEEIFLDGPWDFIYIHHARFKKCITKIYLTEEEMQSISSRMRLETNKNLNEMYPSLKCVIKNPFFYARFCVDTKPLNPLGFSLDIRRLNKKIYDIIDLVKENTFNAEIAAFLIFCMHLRFNITIIGRTDAGKTTLLNAIDMIIPAHFRKIYVEDVIETIDQDREKYHQLKYLVESASLKADLIKDVLQRSPDVLILGEILTKEEGMALFHCLSSGLKGLQTVHANDVISFLNRLVFHFNIEKSCLMDADFIILMKKMENGQRKIVEIAEPVFLDHASNIAIKSLCQYIPEEETWSRVDARGSKKLESLAKTTKLSVDEIEAYMKAIEDKLQVLVESSSHSRADLLEKINQVYRSKIAYF